MSGKVLLLILALAILAFITVFIRYNASNESAQHGSIDNNSREIALPKSVTVSNELIKAGGKDIPVLTVRNFREVLNCESNTWALAIEAQISRNRIGRVECEVWTRKGTKKLNVDGFNAVSRKEYQLDNVQGKTMSVETVEFQVAGIYIGSVKKYNPDSTFSQDRELLIETKSGMSKIPFQQFQASEGIMVDGYRYCAVVKMTLSYDRISILIIDLQHRTIALEVPLPHDLKRDDVYYVLDSVSNVLVAVDTKLHWLIAVDLAPLQKSEPLPPLH